MAMTETGLELRRSMAVPDEAGKILDRRSDGELKLFNDFNVEFA